MARSLHTRVVSGNNGCPNDWASTWLPGEVATPAEVLGVINNGTEFYKVVTTLREYRCADAGSGRVAYLKVGNKRRFANNLLASSGNDAAVSLTDVEKSLADAALDDLAGHILGVEGIDARDIQTRDADGALLDLLRPGAAAVYGELAIGDVPQSVLLSPNGLRGVWSRTVAPSTEEASKHVREALGGLNATSVRVRAQLPSAEMTIGDLASMNVGDVIRLNTRVDEPIAVQVGDSPYALRANLGLASGSRAFQIVGIASQQQNN